MSENEQVQPEVDEEPVIAFSSYAEFIGQLELNAIWLRSSKVTNSTGGVAPGSADVRIGDSFSWKDTEGGFQAFHKYNVEFANGKKKLGKIDVEFVVDYRSDAPMDDDLFEIFSVDNLPLNTWPYLREFVADIVGRMQWLPFTLPTRKFLGGPTIAIPSEDVPADDKL